MREGPALVRASNAYAKEDLGRTWRLWALTCLVFAVGTAIAVAVPFWPVQLAAAIFNGLVIVRMFIFFHDYQHGAIFRKSKLGGAFMTLVGLYTLNPPSVWKETHDYHHKNNAKMLGASIGSYPVVTTRMWKMMSPSQRFWYRFARNPLTILFGYFTLFIGGMCLSSFVRNPRVHWQGPAAIIVHMGTLALLTWAFSWQVAFFGLFLPAYISMLAGAYLFYAQHNFPDVQLVDRRHWKYDFAALKSSSMFDMNPLMHWLTGNIGYHHVHHLNHRIPFYRLPEAMAEIPELQNPGRTTWRPSDVWSCLSLKLWDPEQKRMVGWL